MSWDPLDKFIIIIELILTEEGGCFTQFQKVNGFSNLLLQICYINLIFLKSIFYSSIIIEINLNKMYFKFKNLCKSRLSSISQGDIFVHHSNSFYSIALIHIFVDFNKQINPPTIIIVDTILFINLVEIMRTCIIDEELISWQKVKFTLNEYYHDNLAPIPVNILSFFLTLNCIG